MYENLFNLIDDLQKFTIKIAVQEVLNERVKDERVREILDADVVMEYYEKMYKHFEEHPKDFLFPNREWLKESLKRLKVNLSNVFDEDANVDHIKREEAIVLFILLWIHMVIQNPIRIEVIKDPYDLFYIWTKNRVFISRPTDAQYLQDGDRRVLDRLGKSYGWFTGVHHFSIGFKDAVEYHYSSPDDITNINGAYNKAHCSVKKLRDMNDWVTDGLLHEQHTLADADKLHRPSQFRYMRKDIKFGPHEKGCRYNIARNTKFVVREMTGMSNKDYKAFLKKFKEKEVMRYDETSQCFEDILKISSLEIDHEVILEAVDVYNRNVYHLNKALLKLKEKLNEGR
jgi:hypothetical protein|nr:MAG TPA: hypothetical protein [Caudoviricetes sp.]